MSSPPPVQYPPRVLRARVCRLSSHFSANPQPSHGYLSFFGGKLGYQGKKKCFFLTFFRRTTFAYVIHGARAKRHRSN